MEKKGNKKHSETLFTKQIQEESLILEEGKENRG